MLDFPLRNLESSSSIHLLAQVKKILPFEGVFTLGEDLEAVAAEPLQDLLALLDGFCIQAKGPEVVQSLGRRG